MDEAQYNLPFRAAPGEGEPLPLIGRLKVSSAQTAGAFEVIEYEGPAVPPPHVHHERDECFCIVEGVFTFVLGSEHARQIALNIAPVVAG